MAMFRGLAAGHMDPLIFLAFFVLTGLFRLLASKSNQSRRTDDSPAPQPRSEAPWPETVDSDQERIRRFLEALGQPPSAQPPPQVTPRPVATFPEPEREERARTVRPRRNLLNPLPPLTTTPPTLPRKIQLPGQITRPPYKEKLFVPPRAETPVFEVHKEQGTPEVNEPIPIKTPGDAYAVATAPPPAVVQPSQFATELARPATCSGPFFCGKYSDRLELCKPWKPKADWVAAILSGPKERRPSLLRVHDCALVYSV